MFLYVVVYALAFCAANALTTAWNAHALYMYPSVFGKMHFQIFIKQTILHFHI